MNILSEKKVEYVEMQVDFSDKERSDLVEYARKHIDDDSLINWAVGDILKKKLKAEENLPENTSEQEIVGPENLIE